MMHGRKNIKFLYAFLCFHVSFDAVAILVFNLQFTIYNCSISNKDISQSAVRFSFKMR